jgi:hypothetical protein
MISNNYAVSTTRSLVLAKAPANRTIYLHVLGAGTVYLGGPDVTSSNGLLTEKNAAPQIIVIPSNEELWAVTASGSEDVRIMRPSSDGN